MLGTMRCRRRVILFAQRKLLGLGALVRVHCKRPYTHRQTGQNADIDWMENVGLNSRKLKRKKLKDSSEDNVNGGELAVSNILRDGSLDITGGQF